MGQSSSIIALYVGTQTRKLPIPVRGSALPVLVPALVQAAPKKNEDVAAFLGGKSRFEFCSWCFPPCGNSADVRKSVGVMNENLQ